MYGIGSQSASLVRYEFASGDYNTVGTIRSGGTDLTGIEAAAYVPRSSKILSFWSDPGTV